MKRIFTFLTLIILFPSCRVIMGLHEITTEKARIKHLQMGDKMIGFIPMHHLGKPVFYANVKQLVAEQKKMGSIVYYELIKPVNEPDSAALELLQKKMRKIMGTSKNYKQTMDSIGMFKSYILQPPYHEMGIDSPDVNADVDLRQLIVEWERVQGVVQLDSIDINTPIGAPYLRKPAIKSGKWNKVVLDYRNSSLVNMLKQSKYNKILVVYGAAHYKGVKKLINKKSN